MKKLLIVVLLFPLLTGAQNKLPRFENDTLYTTSGYPLYEGQVLHLANGTSSAGYFKFIKFHTSQGKTNTYSLQNSTILVDKLKAYKNSGGDNSSIRILGMVTYPDGTKEETDIIMNFDKVMESFAGLPRELNVPEEFKNRKVEIVANETKKQPVVPDNKKPVTTEASQKKTQADEMKKQSVADEIRKLFELYKDGALTKEEYETAKKKVLER